MRPGANLSARPRMHARVSKIKNGPTTNASWWRSHVFQPPEFAGRSGCCVCSTLPIQIDVSRWMGRSGFASEVLLTKTVIFVSTNLAIYGTDTASNQIV